jgi:RND family efflux transporter MFP subunit
VRDPKSATLEAQSEDPVAAPVPTNHRKPAKVLRVAVPAAAILLLMFWVAGTFHQGVIQGAVKPAPEKTAAGLATATVTMQTIPAVTEAVGTVQAEQLATVTSRAVANIMEMRVSAGQHVESGEPLVVLDDRDLRRRVEQALDAVRGAEATLAQAQSDYQRDKPLFDEQVITPYDFEHTQTNLKTAEANLHRLQQVEQETEVNLSYAVIHSPFTGVIVDKLASVGDLAAPGKPLSTIYEHGRLWLEASVPEEMLARIHIGESVALRIDARDRESRGKVVEIVPSSDPATRTVAVRVHLDDTREIVPGMFGRLLLPAAPEQLLTIPAMAVIRAGQLTMTDVVERGHVERRTVQLGRALGDRVEVLSGLAAGEVVVVRSATARAKETL